MIAPQEDDIDDSELASQPADPIRAAFGSAAAAIIDALPAGWMREVAVKEIMSAYERAKVALVRRYVN
jgi:hypothetical protein